MTYTVANKSQCSWVAPSTLRVTTVHVLDDHIRYRQIEEKLATLEQSTIRDEETLTFLHMQTCMLFYMDDEREELLIRIRWLKQLYDVAKKVDSVKTKKDIERLQAILTTLPPSPLKRTIEQQLHEKHVGEENDQQWLVPIMEKADPIFLNLGKDGRRAIIRELEEKRHLPLDVLLAYVRERAVEIEENVRQLACVSSIDSLVVALDALPFSLYHSLSHEEKREVAEHLYETKPFHRGCQAVAQAIDTFVRERRTNEAVWGAIAEDGMLCRDVDQKPSIQYVAKRVADDILTFEKNGD